MTQIIKQTIEQIETYTRIWCERAGIPEQDFEDYIQEAQLNALKRNTPINIRRALDRYKHHNFTKLQRFILVADPDRELIEMGQHNDNYHGICADDV